MPIATYQGNVDAAKKQTEPHRQSSRRQQAVGPRNHHDATARRGDQRRADRPLRQGRQRHRSPEARRGPSRRAGATAPRGRTGRADKNRASVASVVASFDSATMIGAVARIRAREPAPRPGRTSAAPSHQVEQARHRARRPPRPSRTPNGLSPPTAVPSPHQPVDEDRLVIPRLAVEAGRDPVAPRPHLADGDGIARLVAVPEADPAVAHEVDRQRQGNDEQTFRDRPASTAFLRRNLGPFVAQKCCLLRDGSRSPLAIEPLADARL